jgi:hypothetical protein
MTMITKVRIFVEDDYVGEVSIKENPRQYWQNFISAANQNPTLVYIEKTSQSIPVEGMIYENGVFVKSQTGEDFISNNIAEGFERFALVVDNVYLASHDISMDNMPGVFEAYQSNPRFVVVVEENRLVNFGQ